MKRVCVLGLLIIFGVKADPVGLSNCGNTCFLNATLQCLYNITPITDEIVNNPNAYLPGTFGYYYTEFCKHYRAASAIVGSPLSCTSSLGDVSRAAATLLVPLVGADALNNDQQDATEAIMALINALVTKDNFIDPAFQSPFSFYVGSNFRIITTCPPGAPVLANTTGYSVYTALPIEKIEQSSVFFTTFDECLKSYYAPTPFDYNPNPATTIDCTTKITIDESFGYLLFSLNRFKAGPPGSPSVKIKEPVQIPVVITIAPFLTNVPADAASYAYELNGVIVHRGSSGGGGHYVAYVKDMRNGKWFYCDDSSVNESKYDAFAADRDKSYLYFYNKKKILPADVENWKKSGAAWDKKEEQRVVEERKKRAEQEAKRLAEEEKKRRALVDALDLLRDRLEHLAGILLSIS